MLKTTLAVGALAVIVVAAVADALRGELRTRARTTTVERPVEPGGPARPAALAPGRLAGRLFVTVLEGCRLEVIDLARVEVAATDGETKCSFAVAPDGKRAVVPRGPLLGSLGRSRAIWLVDVDERIRVLRRLGVARGGRASWSRDGAHVAWCRDDGRTVVLELVTGTRRTLAGCAPKFTADGSVLTRPDEPLTPLLLRDGKVLFDAADVGSGFPPGPTGPLDVLGYDEREDGLLALVAVQFRSGREPSPVLQLWRGRRLAGMVELAPLGSPAGRGRFGERVEFSPDGREVLVAFPGFGVRFTLIDVASGRQLIAPRSQHGVAWSPDGAWFALSTAEEILVYGRDRATPAYVLTVGASTLAWR